MELYILTSWKKNPIKCKQNIEMKNRYKWDRGTHHWKFNKKNLLPYRNYSNEYWESQFQSSTMELPLPLLYPSMYNFEENLEGIVPSMDITCNRCYSVRRKFLCLYVHRTQVLRLGIRRYTDWVITVRIKSDSMWNKQKRMKNLLICKLYAGQLKKCPHRYHKICE